MTNPGNKRLQRAMHGAGGRGNDGGQTAQPANGLRKVSITNGSVINNGGNGKFGLYPTVGVSVGFLNKIVSCCSGNKTGKGVGINTNPNLFLM
uniref:Uncharacterized protein n=1 Tax=viral metagenome TaxID=1070528 RepID=A0A6C0J998_9ZZZZ|tara:strand:- start:1177 stop:1455 length:279 start_codon:yes stop_codon:yes gene_type:complete